MCNNCQNFVQTSTDCIGYDWDKCVKKKADRDDFSWWQADKCKHFRRKL